MYTFPILVALIGARLASGSAEGFRWADVEVGVGAWDKSSITNKWFITRKSISRFTHETIKGGNPALAGYT